MTDLADWIRLTETNGVGRVAAFNLLHAFEHPSRIFKASYLELTAHVSPKQARALLTPPSDNTQTLIQKTLDWASRSGNHIIALGATHYPHNLVHIPDPPTLLYAKGDVTLLKNTTIAVVGSRNATGQGLINAQQFAASLSQTGITISSGLALGIDAAAHLGGLEGIGKTVAVIGTGADIVYPARNRDLAHRIAQEGCIVSEYPLGTPAIAANFPRRNRLISGLAQGVLVIEAAAQSGSLITARMALEQGRDVFAIPGSIHSPLAKGCHLLIKQGAKLVETAQDILQELRPSSHHTDEVTNIDAKEIDNSINNGRAISVNTASILNAMGFEPIHPDVLIERCNIDSGELSSELLMLELEGHIEMLAGGTIRQLKQNK